MSAGRSLREGFLACARSRPESIALAVDGEEHSYARLEECARVWAAAIVDASDGPPQRVAVFAYRSFTAYAGTLAALFSGAAFVPLNRTFPVERTRRMLRLADVDALICDAASERQLEKVLEGLERRPLILRPETSAVEAEPLEELPAVAQDSLAYLLFTSGSTGMPKGVPIEHRNVRHFVDLMVRRYGVTPEDRFSQTFDQTFDLSVFDLFVAWEAGARVCVPKSLELLAPSRYAAKHALTIWFSVPSLPALMRKKNLLQPGIFPTLRWSLFCGEPLPAETAAAWQEAAPNSIVENLYGPTELTIACMVHRWDPQSSPAMCVNGIVPIGEAYEGMQELVLNEQLQPVEVGADGELCLNGAQTFPGYWRDAQKSAERFVDVDAFPGAPFYRTGDRVRRLEHGEYVHLGRTDSQIKVLGHRVELGEIEAALLAQPRIVQAVAAGWPVEDGSAQGIVAFVSGADLDPAEIQQASRAGLPAYMVPSRIELVSQMPLNANGKIDRRALIHRLES